MRSRSAWETTPISQGDWRLMFLEHDRIQQVTP